MPRNSIYGSYRYLAGFISYAVGFYFRFPLSLRLLRRLVASRSHTRRLDTGQKWKITPDCLLHCARLPRKR
jgi:hypothetical protein